MTTIRYGRLAPSAIAPALLLLSTVACAQTSSTPAATPKATSTAAVTARQTQPPPAPTVAKPAGAAAAVVVSAKPAPPGQKPGQEGVTMHGHWIIDLRNPDGTIAEHRDFENALLSGSALLQIVTGQSVPGDLGITIASTGSNVCATGTNDTALGNCLVAASATAGLGGFTCSTAYAGQCNYTLKEVTNGGGGNGAITLSGTMPVLASGAVTEVGTQLFTCSSGGAGTFSTVDPVGCYNQTEGGSYFYGNLTGTSITPLNVTTGQTIAFTVVLTFS